MSDARPECGQCREGGVPVRVLAHKAATAYAVVRAVRLAQAHWRLPGGEGLTVRGRHVHHHVWGLLLVTAATTARGKACLHRPLRANVVCTGVALVMDEYDVLLAAEDAVWAPPVRALLDVLGLAGAASGAVRWRSTWSGWYRCSDHDARRPRADAGPPRGAERAG